MFGPIKLFPLSLWNILALPLLLISCLSAWMKLCAVKQPVASTCIALLDKHVNIAPHLSWIFDGKLTKHVNLTISEGSFFWKSISMEVSHLLLTYFSMQLYAPYTFGYDWLDSTCGIDNPIPMVTNLINCHSLASMCNLSMMVFPDGMRNVTFFR